jgi:hypothetical protein
VSETFAQAAQNIRQDLKDLNAGNYAINTFLQLYPTLNRKAQLLANEAGVGKTTLPNAITSVAGSVADLQLPSSVQYHTIHAVRDTNLGVELDKKSLDEINSMRRGIKANTSGRGFPSAFCIFDDEAQATWIRWNTVPSQAINYDLTRSAMPANIVVKPTMGTDYTLPFYDNFCRTIEIATALELWGSMTPDVLQRIGMPAPFMMRGKTVPPAIIQQWTQQVADGIAAEQLRKRRVESRPYGVGAVLGF